MYTKEGVHNVREMKRLLKFTVKNEIFKDQALPEVTNKRYFPTSRSVKNHISKARRKQTQSLIDQECLQEKIGEWKKSNPTTKIHLRTKSLRSDSKEERKVENDGSSDEKECIEDEISGVVKIKTPSSNTFMFVYQTKWQRQLLHRYGTEMVFLDATYRTTRYALPLFFLVVKTNMDYQIAATFVIESETTSSIREALQVIKDWNPDIQPQYAMTDYCNEEILAFESVFPGNL